MLRNKPQPAAVFGADIGKNVFHVVGADAAGVVVQKTSSGGILSFGSSRPRKAASWQWRLVLAPNG